MTILVKSICLEYFYRKKFTTLFTELHQCTLSSHRKTKLRRFLNISNTMCFFYEFLNQSKISVPLKNFWACFSVGTAFRNFG